MLIMQSFQKSLIVEQFQGNYLKWKASLVKSLSFFSGNLRHREMTVTVLTVRNVITGAHG